MESPLSWEIGSSGKGCNSLAHHTMHACGEPDANHLWLPRVFYRSGLLPPWDWKSALNTNGKGHSKFPQTPQILSNYKESRAGYICLKLNQFPMSLYRFFQKMKWDIQSIPVNPWKTLSSCSRKHISPHSPGSQGTFLNNYYFSLVSVTLLSFQNNPISFHLISLP